MLPVLFFLKNYCSVMSVTLSTLPGKFKCSLNDFFCPDGINPNFGLTGPNNTIYIYIYIYIYMCVCVCVCVYIYIYIYIYI